MGEVIKFINKEMREELKWKTIREWVDVYPELRELGRDNSTISSILLGATKNNGYLFKEVKKDFRRLKRTKCNVYSFKLISEVLKHYLKVYVEEDKIYEQS